MAINRATDFIGIRGHDPAGAIRTYPGRLSRAHEAAIKRRHARFAVMAQSHPQ
jgi:hypothetical protein